jgi:hypothetical protein
VAVHKAGFRPAEILAFGPSCVSPRRSSNANSLCGQNSAPGRSAYLCRCATGEKGVIIECDLNCGNECLKESPA